MTTAAVVVPDQCRAKIRVSSMEIFSPQLGSDTKVSFSAVYKDDPSHENKAFWKYTPNISFTMTLSKEATGAIAFFRDKLERNAELYLDFTEAPAS
jgi:hypothetical protein